jgi:hypothetical protein
MEGKVKSEKLKAERINGKTYEKSDQFDEAVARLGPDMAS